MTASMIEIELPLVESVEIEQDSLTVELSDGRSLAVPLYWYPRLEHGNRVERENWRLIGGGRVIHWQELDEDISVEGLLMGRPSAESATLLQRWLSTRRGTHRDRAAPHGAPLPHHLAYGSVLGGSADPSQGSEPGDQQAE